MQKINTNAVISMQNVKIAIKLNVCVKMHITGMQLHALLDTTLCDKVCQ
jgi:hypothetical protein